LNAQGCFFSFHRNSSGQRTDYVDMMNMNRMSSNGRVLAVLLALTVWVVGSGCESCKPGKPGKPTRYNVQVNLDPALKDSSMEIHLVGISPGNLQTYMNYSMTDYWKKNKDPLREGADKRVMSFLDGTTLSQTLTNADPIWTSWLKKGVTHVMVFSNLPGAPADKPGAQDPRRQVLNLSPCKWVKKTKTLTVEVKRSGIEVRTSVRPGFENE